MPTPINLIDEIAERIEGVVGDYRYAESNDEKTTRAPRVFRQFLPDKYYSDGPDEADYPLVLVVLGNVETADIAENGGYPVAEVTITCAAHDIDRRNQGWRVPTDIATRIMIDLQQRPELGAFALELPLIFEISRIQSNPEWTATIATRWRLPSVRRNIPPKIFEGMYGGTPHREEMC